MKTILRDIGWMLLGSASAAYAAQGGEGQEIGWLGYLFAAFFALIVVTQLVPAVVLFIGMVKGVFSPRAKKESTAARID